MAGRTRFLSALLLFHAIAIGVDAIPSPDGLIAVKPEVRHPANDAVAARLTPLFDRAAIEIARLEPMIYSALEPLRKVTRPYINAGLRQGWTMFTEIEAADHYMRLDYYVASAGSTTPQRIQELVLPVGRDDRIRIGHDFRDKAIVNLMVAFFDDQSKPGSAPEHPDGFRPLVRYFTSRYRSRELSDGERIVRTEVWWGSALIPPPGQSLPGTREARLDALTRLYGGPVPSVLGLSSPHAPGDQEQDADITWKLEFVDRP
jgi:hypothetical protein